MNHTVWVIQYVSNKWLIRWRINWYFIHWILNMFKNHVIDPPKYRLGVTVKIYKFLFVLSCIFSHWFHLTVNNEKLNSRTFSGGLGSSWFNSLISDLIPEKANISNFWKICNQILKFFAHAITQWNSKFQKFLFRVVLGTVDSIGWSQTKFLKKHDKFLFRRNFPPKKVFFSKFEHYTVRLFFGN